jgi:hypothetical protein
MSGTPMLTVFHVDMKNQAVKDFGKRVAGIAKSGGGPKYLTYIPKSGDGPKDVVYVWFPDGPEGASYGGKQAAAASTDASALADLAKKAKGGYKGFGKARLNRVAENGRVAGKPPAYLAVMGVKVDKGKAQAFKAGLKAVHQEVLSKNKGVRYAAHKLGDGEHGVVMYGMDSEADLKKTDHAKADAAVSKNLSSKLSAGAVKGSKKMILKYVPEYSNP